MLREANNDIKIIITNTDRVSLIRDLEAAFISSGTKSYYSGEYISIRYPYLWELLQLLTTK